MLAFPSRPRADVRSCRNSLGRGRRRRGTRIALAPEGRGDMGRTVGSRIEASSARRTTDLIGTAVFLVLGFAAAVLPFIPHGVGRIVFGVCGLGAARFA